MPRYYSTRSSWIPFEARWISDGKSVVWVDQSGSTFRLTFSSFMLLSRTIADPRCRWQNVILFKDQSGYRCRRATVTKNACTWAAEKDFNARTKWRRRGWPNTVTQPVRSVIKNMRVPRTERNSSIRHRGRASSVSLFRSSEFDSLGELLRNSRRSSGTIKCTSA